MGITALTKLLADSAPGSIRETKFANYFGRRLAMDSSLAIYQFLVVVGRSGEQASALATSQRAGVGCARQWRLWLLLLAAASWLGACAPCPLPNLITTRSAGSLMLYESSY